MANETDASKNTAADNQTANNQAGEQTNNNNAPLSNDKSILDSIGQSANKVFMAGVGAVVVGAQKGKELVEQLATKGQESFGQGKDINKELTHKAGQATKNIRESALEMRMKAMSPEERIEFASKAAQLAEEQNLAQEQKERAASSANDERIDINKATQAAEKLEG